MSKSLKRSRIKQKLFYEIESNGDKRRILLAPRREKKKNRSYVKAGNSIARRPWGGAVWSPFRGKIPT